MAAGYDGSIRIDSAIDRRGFNAGIKSMTGSLKGLAAAVGLAFSAAAVVLFGKTALKAASDVEEMANKFNAVFKGLAAGVEQQLTEFADATNRSKYDLMAYAALLQDTFVPLGFAREQAATMSVQVVKLATDLASFNNMNTADVVRDIQSALVGNTETLRKYGVVANQAQIEQKALNMGLWSGKGMMTAQAKAATILQLALEGNSDAQGDAIRTAGSLANQVRGLTSMFTDFKVAVGQAITPLVQRVIPVIRELLGWLTAWAQQLAMIVAILLGVNLASQQAAQGAQQMTSATQDQADALDDATKAAKGALAAFDELNVLQQDQAQPETPGGGTPIAGADTGAVNDELDGLKAKLDALKASMADLFAPLIESAGRLFEALKPLGQDIWDGLKWAWDNILVPFATWTITDLLPTFLDLVTAGVTALDTVIEVNKPLAKAFFENFLKPLAQWTGGAIIDVLKWLTDRLYDLSDWMMKHQKTVQTITTILAIFAGAWILVNSVIAIATAVTTAFGIAVAILTSPILLVVLAVGALIAAVYLLITHWDEVKRTAEITWELIKVLWGIAAQWFMDNVVNPIANGFETAWNGIKTFAAGTWEAIKVAWSLAKEWFQTGVIDPIKNGFDTALNAIKTAFETIFTGIKTFIKGEINGIIGLINGMISALVAGVNVAISSLNTLSIDIPGFDAGPLGSFGGYSFGLHITPISAPQIPKLATGAVIPPNAAFAAILGDQRSGRNLEAPEGLLRQIVREELGQQQNNINVTFGGSMGELVRLLKPQIERENTRVGTSLIQSGVTS